MKQLIVQPLQTLSGEVAVPGSKNSSLALTAAACLADEPVILKGIPRIADMDVFYRIGQEIGLEIHRDEENTLLIDPRGIRSTVVDPVHASSFRTAYYFVGALLTKFGKVSVGYPGGDDFAGRPIDQHIKALMAMGARFRFHSDYYEVECAQLKGADIYFDTISSGATINTMLAAARANGKTTLRQAARDPEVVDTAQLLIRMGAKIRGAGTDTISITGVTQLRGCSYTAIPDRLIAGSFLIAAGATGGIVTVKDAIPEHLGSCLAKLKEIGMHVEADESAITAFSAGRLRATRVRTAMYPGFPTDLQQPLTALLTTVPGTSLVADRIYPKRYQHVPQLNRMGANIDVRFGVARIKGGAPLRGGYVHATDVRAGICLLIAALAAEGVTTITGIRHIERGYENIVGSFRSLGAELEMRDIGAERSGVLPHSG
ncbi:UDP-N-acetylglucosamine 1-carboxyvinyltransferase [Paenibacillaceae bacterium WGS1546]|uniref:UDP-N-acetylglucosamine 1-carboxyvinyltransferase n=1 Tax=Cohnella sp. WGS1546 TaxID=3366810 RepID=UPI00372D25F4